MSPEEFAGAPNYEAFAKAAMESWSLHRGGDLNGGDLNDLAVEHGLLVGVPVAGPCDSEECGGCECANLGADFPTTCWRIPWLVGCEKGKP